MQNTSEEISIVKNNNAEKVNSKKQMKKKVNHKKTAIKNRIESRQFIKMTIV